MIIQRKPGERVQLNDFFTDDDTPDGCRIGRPLRVESAPNFPPVFYEVPDEVNVDGVGLSCRESVVYPIRVFLGSLEPEEFISIESARAIAAWLNAAADAIEGGVE